MLLFLIYPSNASKLNREEQRVLKAVLMMQAISKKMNNGVELLRPTAQNLGLAFEGDDSMENNRAINIARNQLVQKKILYIDTNGSVEEFAASAIAGDQVQIDAIKDRLRKETKTAKLIDDGDLLSAFTFNSALRARYNFQYATVDNFKVTINKINNMPKSYKFNAVICIARTEEEQITLRLKIAEAVQDSAYADIIFIDATSNIMGADRFEQWISVAAQTEYWRPKDPRLADNKQTDVKRTLADWKNDIAGGKFTVYFGTGFKENAPSMTLLKEKLAAVVLKVYPLSFDNCNVSDQFFTDAKFADAAKKGIAMAKTVDFTRPGIFQEKYVKAMLGDALGIEHFEEAKPYLSISKLKLKVKALIDGVFEKDVRIAISDIFDYLMKEGFMPCAMYAYLAGFAVDEAVKNVSEYLSSDNIYPYFVSVSGSDEYRVLLHCFVSLKKIKVSEFCSADAYLDLDGFLDAVKEGHNGKLILGVGEYITCGGNNDILYRLKNLPSPKTVVLCRGIKQELSKLNNADRKFNARRFCCVDSELDFSVISAEFPIGSQLCKGYKNLIAVLEDGANGNVYVKTSLNVAPTRKISSAYDAIREQDIHFELPRNCLDDEQWSEFLKNPDISGSYELSSWRAVVFLPLVI